MRLLHGEKKNLKYQIKLNDEILDKKKRSKSMNPELGKLILGPNYAEEQVKIEPHLAVRNKDLFGISKKNSVGPQDYDPNIIGRST